MNKEEIKETTVEELEKDGVLEAIFEEFDTNKNLKYLINMGEGKAVYLLPYAGEVEKIIELKSKAPFPYMLSIMLFITVIGWGCGIFSSIVRFCDGDYVMCGIMFMCAIFNGALAIHWANKLLLRNK